MNKKNVVIFILSVSFIILFFLLKEDNSSVQTNIINQNSEDGIIDGYSNFEDDFYKFSLLYPKSMEVNQYSEGANSKTITFQDTENGLGFQIFIIPYNKDHVADEQFLRDIPSGIRKNIKKIDIDGASGVFFDSTDILFGNTKEIWFIKNGYLFEVTTIEDLEQFIIEIMETWRFVE